MKKNKDKRTYYICGTEWQHEINETSVILYSTLKELKNKRTCIKQCGVVKLDITAKWVKKQTLLKNKS